MNRTIIIFLFGATLVCAGPIAAQDDVLYNAQAEELFLLGVRQYTQQDFRSAYQTLSQAAGLQMLHQRTTAALVMAAKAANGASRFLDAVRLCRELLERHPQSSYAEDARFTLGCAYGGLHLYVQAAGEMVAVMSTAQVRVTRWRAAELLGSYMPWMSASEIHALESLPTDDSARVVVSLLRAEAYARAGRLDSADMTARALAARTADKALLRRARRLMQDARAGPSDTLTVGVLLPFMNHLKDASREQAISLEILKGIREALQEHSADPTAAGVPLRIDVRDTQRRKDRIERIIMEWRADSTVIAILGPLFSDETMTAAAKANEAEIPLVSPTATGNNIASIGPYIFQANPDYAMRGTLMAQYAVRTAGAATLGVLTTQEPPGSLLADAFATEAARLGAHVVSIQKYPGDVTDFRHFFRAMKAEAAAAKKGPLQAVYCPIASSSEIGAVSSQLRLFDGRITVLGSDEWNDDEELDRNRNSADGVIFSSDRWDEDGTHRISGLSFESFGYDAASLVFRCIAGTGATRARLAHTLAGVRVYDGIHSRISFLGRRVNVFLHILQYKGGFIRKISEMEYRQ